MGELFKVLIIGRGLDAASLCGLASGDHSGAL